MKNLSIRKKIFLYYCIFTILFFVIIGFAVYFFFFRTLKTNEIEYSIEAANKTRHNIEFLLNIINNTATLLVNNEDIQRELSIYKGVEGNVLNNNINNILKNTISVQEYIKGIYIIGDNGKFYTSDWGIKEDYLKERFKFAFDNTDKQELFTESNSRNYHLYSQVRVLTYVRPIINYRKNIKYGILIIDINYDYIREMVFTTSVESDRKLLIVNREGETLFTVPYNTILDEVIQTHPEILENEKLKITDKVFGKDSIIVSNTVKYTDWKIIHIQTIDKILSTSKKLGTVVIKMFLVYLFLAIAGSYIFSYTLTKPITELSKKIMLVEKGNLSVNVSVRSNDELGQLSDSFNKMVLTLKNLINEVVENEQKKSEMEFQVLQSQINPHFLYNTLDSIKWLATLQNMDNISTMVTSIINLLKYNISRTDKIVELSEEIDSVKNYVNIQKYRYGDMFNVNYHIDQQTLKCNTIRFILQPIVENAIFHGFENIEYDGLIEIKTYTQDTVLYIQVKDNGKGIMDEKLRDIKTSSNFKGKFSNIGIKNIDERIKFYCGKDYGLTIDSIINTGTTVTIKLPLNISQENITDKYIT